MSTKETPGPFDALEKAKPDEPIFTLCARDPLAAPLVRRWVDQRRHTILRAGLSPEKETIELIQAREAETVAEEMEEWVRGAAPVEAIKASTKPVRASNSMAADELAAKARFDTLKHIAGRLYNSIAEVNDARKLLDSDNDFARDELETALNAMRFVAELVEPKRTSYAHQEVE